MKWIYDEENSFFFDSIHQRTEHNATGPKKSTPLKILNVGLEEIPEITLNESKIALS